MAKQRLTKMVAELEQVRRNDGGILRPQSVVEFATNPECELHKHFEWDDSKAAHEHRLEQARSLIRCAVTRVSDSAAPIRMYVSLVEDRDAGDSYRMISDVMADEDSRASLLAQALRDADSWRVRYQRLVELSPVFEAISSVRTSKKNKRRKAG